MKDDNEREVEWVAASAMAAPALLGAAAGLILGEAMHPRARRGMAIGLAAVGLAAAAPLAVSGILDWLNGPQSRRGVARRISRIRDAGDGFVDPELAEEEYY